jgi:hypothetical protein
MIDEKRRQQRNAAMRKFYKSDKGRAWKARQIAARRESGNGAKWARERRERYYKLIHQIKSGPCADCGDTFDPICMDFDHRPGEVKSFNLSTGYRHSAEAVLSEIAKCEVVCANCHRIRTHRERSHRDTCARK